jgi:hypothetical protein
MVGWILEIFSGLKADPVRPEIFSGAQPEQGVFENEPT